MSGHPEADIYHRQGMGQASGIGAAPALVIVDFVNGFADPAHFGGGNVGPAIDRTARLLALARARGWPVAHSRVVYAEDGSDAGVFTLKAPSLKKLTEHNPLSHIVTPLAPNPGELVVRKQGASAFFDTNLAGWLAYRRVDTVLVAGCTTSGCVRATIVDAMQHNLRTICVTDCVGDRAIAPHEANLFDIGQKYADLMTLAEVESALSAAPAMPVRIGDTVVFAPRAASVLGAASASAPEPAPAAGEPPAEIREEDAPPAIAAIYAELRQSSGVPLINLIWRHAATMPGALPWMWRVAGPVLRSGMIAAASRRIGQGIALPALREADPVAIGMQLADLGRVLDLAEVYNRGNLTNLVVLTALYRLLRDGPAPQLVPPGPPVAPLRMLPAVPRVPRLGDLPPAQADMVRALAARHGAAAGGVIPSLYLHLAIWPPVLAALPSWLGPALTPEGLGEGRDSAIALARAEAEAIWPMLGDDPPPEAARAALLAALERFTTQIIPAMVPVGMALRKVLGG